MHLTQQSFLQISLKLISFFSELLLFILPSINPTSLSTSLSRCPLGAQAREGIPSGNLVLRQISTFVLKHTTVWEWGNWGVLFIFSLDICTYTSRKDKMVLNKKRSNQKQFGKKIVNPGFSPDHNIRASNQGVWIHNAVTSGYRC